MLEAKKKAWFEKIFAIYNRNLFKRRFNSLRISGLEFLAERDLSLPLIIYANHSSWWDGLVAFEISRQANLDAYVMMEEKQLKSLFLFRWLGAFSVVRENPREAVKSVNYAADLLQNSNRSLWIFPQGEILPNDSRPIKFYNGTSRIAEKLKNCQAVSIAICYEFLGEFKPEIFVKISSPEKLIVDNKFISKDLTKCFETKLTQGLDKLTSEISATQIESYHRIF